MRRVTHVQNVVLIENYTVARCVPKNESQNQDITC